MKHLVLVFLIGVVLLTACANQPDTDSKPEAVAPREDVIIALDNEPEGGFDPCTGWGRYGSPLIQSTLLEMDQEMNFINDLAVRHEISEDGLELTFTLREDAYFTDGQPLTAHDVVFTFQTAKKSASIVDLTSMEDVFAPDAKTVVFRLKHPESAFLYTIAATGIVPKHMYGDNYGKEPVGSGPFRLVQWDKGQQVILERNDSYYGKLPAMKQVTILFMSEGAAIAAAMAGQLDITGVSPVTVGKLPQGMTLSRLQSIDNRGITLPVIPEQSGSGEQDKKIGNDITSDIAIRRALSYGVDRQMLVEQVLNGYGRPAYTECDGMPWASEDAVVAYDRPKALKLLEEGGWILEDDGIRRKNGKKAAFTLLYSADDTTRQALCVAVAQQAKELGIEITTLGTSWDEIDTKMYSNAVLMGWGAQTPLETYLLYHTSNKGKDYYNPENYSSADVDASMERALEEKDYETAMQYWKEVQWNGQSGVSTQGDCPWVWLINVDHLYYVKDGLDIGSQKIHPHGHAWPLAANLKDWKWLL